MISSPERIAANQANAQKSCGPRTAEGKEASRANSYKHGLTGAGIVQARADAEAVESLSRKFRAEMRPVTEVGGCLLDQMAVLVVRANRCVLEDRNRLAEMNDGEGGLFDPSPEGLLLQKYELAARGNFFKAYATFRKVEAEARADGTITPLPIAPVAPPATPPMGSFLPATPRPATLVEAPAPPLEPKPKFAPTRTPNPPLFTPEVMPFGSGWTPDMDR